MYNTADKTSSERIWVVKWFGGASVDTKSGCFSFLDCCHHLSLDPQAVRKAIESIDKRYVRQLTGA